MIKQNIEISLQLKERIKYFNTYTELLFETNAENLSQCSLTAQQASDLEFQTDSDHTSLNQISQTSIITKFQNDLLNQSQNNNQKTYQKRKTMKIIKKSKSALKKEESYKNIQSLKDLQSTEYPERKINLNSQLNQNKNLFPVAVSEKCIGYGDSQLEYPKEQSKIYFEKDSELLLNQLCNYPSKSISKELEDNLISIQQQNMSNQQEANQKKRKLKKNLTYQSNQNQISINFIDNHIPSYTQNEETKNNSSKGNTNISNNKQVLNSKRNTFQQSNDSKITIEQFLSNLSLKQILEGNETNISYENFIQNFENYLKSQNISQYEQIQLSDPEVINKILFEYLFQNILQSKKSNQSNFQQKLWPSQKNLSILQVQSMEFQNSLNFDQNMQKAKSKNLLNSESVMSNTIENIKKLQQSRQKNESNQIKQSYLQQEQQSENDNNYITKQAMYEKFEVIKNFRKFFPHNNFDNIISQQKLKKFNKFKKPKVNSIKQKERRQNVIIQQDVTRKFQYNLGIIQNNFQSLIDIDKYKPTYLSYGVSQKNDILYPKQFANHNSINFI
ncbi:hypothetical protein ABPG74_007439 [Tetrahymena malaccensis]